MDKKRLEAGAFIVIGLAILLVWAWQSFIKPETPKSQEAVLQTPEVGEAKIEIETSQYKISASYPEFRNLGDPNRESAANNLIKQKVEQSVNAFKQSAAEAEDISPNIKSEVEIKYEVVYLNPSVASIKMSEYTYIEGAAHPLGLYWPFNYNFKDNKEIALADLFSSGSNYLSMLSNLSRESLKTQLKENYDPGTVEFGTTPKPENFSVFFLDKDKLTIIFNVYQVTGYAAGPQQVEIPYEKMGDIVSQEFLSLIKS